MAKISQFQFVGATLYVLDTQGNLWHQKGCRWELVSVVLPELLPPLPPNTPPDNFR